MTLTPAFDWLEAGGILKDFGGEPITLHVPKTGMPYFDALRLYGAVDLYVGLREDVRIRDAGQRWIVEARARPHRLRGKDESCFAGIRGRTTAAKDFCEALREMLLGNGGQPPNLWVAGGGKWDSSLQDGIRGVAAREYETLQNAQTARKECKARIPLSDAILALAGASRVEGIGEITFLPIFEGSVDLSKVVSPLRARIGAPNVACAQALILLVLKTSLFAEGYQDRLTAVVYNTRFRGHRSDNYSGVISLDSTAVGRTKSSGLCEHMQTVFRDVVEPGRPGSGWKRQGRGFQSTPHALDAMNTAAWILHPTPRHLNAMITAQERRRKAALRQLFSGRQYVQEMFKMTYGKWTGDHEAVRRFAKAVSSGIYHARMAEEKEGEARGKAWYDEVTMLRSSPSPRAFIERAMILIEQGHREHSQVGTEHRDEAFDPRSLLVSLGGDRSSFESFRDLFRMYLVQQSTYPLRTSPESSERLATTSDIEDVVEEHE